MLQIKTIKTHYQKYDCQVSKIVFYVKLLCASLRLAVALFGINCNR